MLRELKIENLAIIEELDLEFQEGFVVLTGETGAGKSIILFGNQSFDWGKSFCGYDSRWREFLTGSRSF